MEGEINKLISVFKNRYSDFYTANEAIIKQTIILPLFINLGWDIYDSEEVFPEYSTGGQRVDYSLRLEKQNKVFIEAKKIREDLSIHQEQLLQYAFKAGIEVAVLTNGFKWWFYLPLNPGDWKDRRCCSIDMIHQDENEIIKNFINFLSKENILSGKSIEHLKSAKTLYQQKQSEDEERTRTTISDNKNEYNRGNYVEKGYIDVQDNFFVKRIVDGCNLFGYNYKGFQRGFVKHPIEAGRRLWFPKIVNKGDWDNEIIDGGKTIIERSEIGWRKKLSEDPELIDPFNSDERVTFTGEIDSFGQYGYRFRGVYLIDKEMTKEKGVGIYKRIDTRVKIYKPLSEI